MSTDPPTMQEAVPGDHHTPKPRARCARAWQGVLLSCLHCLHLTGRLACKAPEHMLELGGPAGRNDALLARLARNTGNDAARRERNDEHIRQSGHDA